MHEKNKLEFLQRNQISEKKSLFESIFTICDYRAEDSVHLGAFIKRKL